MTTLPSFQLSPKFIDTILNNSFGIPSETYTDTNIYVGLGIEFNNETFTFTKEPVSKNFTILNHPCIFSAPINGVIRNTNTLEWDKATVNWTTGTDKIQYVGLYYRNQTTTEEPVEYSYELIAVLQLIPAETVLINERMVLNANSIQLKLSNR